MKINCGFIPPNLLESELFGYDAGAFAGPQKTGNPGLIDLSHNGTCSLTSFPSFRCTFRQSARSRSGGEGAWPPNSGDYAVSASAITAFLMNAS